MHQRFKSKVVTRTLAQFTSTTIVEVYKCLKVWSLTIMGTWLRHLTKTICSFSRSQPKRILYRIRSLEQMELLWAKVSHPSQSKETWWILRMPTSPSHLSFLKTLTTRIAWMSQSPVWKLSIDKVGASREQVAVVIDQASAKVWVVREAAQTIGRIKTQTRPKVHSFRIWTTHLTKRT